MNTPEQMKSFQEQAAKMQARNMMNNPQWANIGRQDGVASFGVLGASPIRDNGEIEVLLNTMETTIANSEAIRNAFHESLANVLSPSSPDDKKMIGQAISSTKMGNRLSDMVRRMQAVNSGYQEDMKNLAL